MNIHPFSLKFYNFNILALLLSSLSLIPTAAQADPSAHGVKQMLLACDRTVDGWQVGSAQAEITVNPGAGNDNFPLVATPPAQGEQCLPILARFPVGTVGTPTFLLPKTAAGACCDIPACLIWIIEGADVNASTSEPVIVSCDADGLGNMPTQDVFGIDYTPAPDEQCLTTVLALEQMGYRRRQGPITATLGQVEEDQYVGGLLWTKQGAGSMEVIECNKDPVNGLIVTSHENEHGLLPTGGSCLTAIAEGTGNGAFSLNGPTALPAAGTGTDDPGSLVWDVASGPILE